MPNMNIRKRMFIFLSIYISIYVYCYLVAAFIFSHLYCLGTDGAENTFVSEAVAQ
jgi:hypothetical protein